MRKYLFVPLLFFSLFAFSCKPVLAQQFNSSTATAIIERVYDGDTFYSKDKTFRLFGVDTAELKQNGIPTKGKTYFFANAAKDFVISTILNNEITYKTITKDFYKRTVAKITYNQNDLATLLLGKGLAVVAYFDLDPKNYYYYNDPDYYNNLYNAQYRAKSTKKGLWSLTIEKVKEIFPKHKL